jgi:hypothetical protein
MYQPCDDCGSLVSCYCFTLGRFNEDTYSEVLGDPIDIPIDIAEAEKRLTN